MDEREKAESFALCSIDGLGRAGIMRLLEKTESVSEALTLSEPALREILGEARAKKVSAQLSGARADEAAKKLEDFQKRGIFFLPLWDDDYPKRLRQIPDPPAALYGIGRVPDDPGKKRAHKAPDRAGGCRKAAAVVGARAASAYGQEMAAYFGRGLAKEGITVVSGMARGADGIAQTAALQAGGFSIAVLGCGVDVCYPPENRKLYDLLKERGCILSEYPPGTQPHAHLFPPRNRIISGLSDLVLVIEAREKSGTLITVDMALEQGRDVFAVPGRITDLCSRGCNRLIGNGAGAAVSVAQILRELDGGGSAEVPDDDQKHAGRKGAAPDGKKPAQSEGAPASLRSPFRRAVWEALDTTPESLDAVLLKLREGGWEASAPAVMEELVFLELDGLAGASGGQYYRKLSENFCLQ